MGKRKTGWKEYNYARDKRKETVDQILRAKDAPPDEEAPDSDEFLKWLNDEPADGDNDGR